MEKRKAFCLINHTLTPNQIKELKEVYCVDQICYPSESLREGWSQIAPVKELDYEIIEKIKLWIKDSDRCDVLIIQGEFGHTFAIVDYAIKKGLVPVHAVTERKAIESVDGEIVKRSYIFEHVCFREYRYL